MIRYALACDAGHRFESWFGSSAAFDDLAGRGLVSCPACGSSQVSKAIMAPAVVAKVTGKAAGQAVAKRADERADGRAADAVPSGPAAPAPTPHAWLPNGEAGRELRALVRAFRAKVLAETQDVGARFPAEVRRMHEGEIPRRDIRGEATLDEARELLEDGIAVLPVPAAPDDLN